MQSAGGSPQNVYLLPQHPNFHLKRCPRPKHICDHPTNKPDKISHPATASPGSRSTASQIEFATGTTGNTMNNHGKSRKPIRRGGSKIISMTPLVHYARQRVDFLLAACGED
jgi:hypothetical protein